MNTLLATTVMGSYPQPEWLVDHERLVAKGVPRVKADELWRIEPEHRGEAIEAATLMAIADQQAAGIDIVTDGEIGRESYFNHFATSLGGVDPDNVGVATNRVGRRSDVPLVNGPIVRSTPIELDAARFLVANATRATKVTVPGPFTLSRLAQNDFYSDDRSLTMAYAEAVRAELLDLADAGVDVVQIDEPYLQANASEAAAYAVEAIARAVEDVEATTVVHTCYGYAAYVADKSSGYPFLDPLADLPVDAIAIETAQPGLDPAIVARLAPRGVVLGVLDLGSDDIERPDDIAARIRAALSHIEPTALSLAPDCGMKFLSRPTARAKLAAMVEAAVIVRDEIDR